MPTQREYLEKLRKLPADAPCEDSAGYKLGRVQSVIRQLEDADLDARVPRMPRVRQEDDFATRLFLRLHGRRPRITVIV